MAQTNEGLVLYLPFSEISDGKIPDRSGNNNHGVISGTPTLVNDPFFGAALALNGTDEFITVANNAGLQITGDQTLAMWLKASALGTRQNPFAKAYGGEGTITLEVDGTITYYYGTAGKNAKPYQGVKTTEVLITGEWAHVAVVRDLQAKKITWYINGQQAGQATATYDTPKASTANITIGKGYKNNYAGSIAHLRLYNRALTNDEILRDLDDDQTALAAFRMTHPVSFSLYDQDQQNVLSIRNRSEKSSYHLEVSNDTRRQIVFKNNGASPGEATADNSFFEVVFRPGTLTEASLGAIAVAETGWTIGHALQSSGAVSLFFHTAQDVTLGPGAVQTLTLQNVEVEAGGGSRGTRVEFRYRDLHVGNEQAVGGTRLQHVSIINESGRRTIPLHFGFNGPRTVVNNGTTANTLTLRITNTMTLDPAYPDRSTIRFNPAGHAAPSKLILSFDTQAQGQTRQWAIANNDQAFGFQVAYQGATIPAEGEEGASPEWIIPLGITQLAAGQYIDIDVSAIKTTLQAGPTTVYLHYENMPDYRDGTLDAVAEKSPLLFINSPVTGRTGDITNPNGSFFRLYDIPTPGSGSIPGTRLMGEWRGGNAGAQVRFSGAGNTFIDIGQNASGDFTVSGTALTPRLVVQNGGNVGVGTSNPGTSKLKIANSATDFADVRFAGSGMGQLELVGWSSGWNINAKTNGKHLYINRDSGSNSNVLIGRNGKEMFVQGSDGSVGIGTTAPAAKLQIINANQTANGNTLILGPTDKSNLRLGYHQDYSWIQSHGLKPLSVNPVGNNVGIGTTSPSEKLHVSGTVKASAFKIGSTAISESDLKILKKLAAGTLVVDLYNTKQKEYMYAGDYKPFDGDRRRVFTWRKGTRINQGRWRLRYPGS